MRKRSALRALVAGSLLLLAGLSPGCSITFYAPYAERVSVPVELERALDGVCLLYTSPSPRDPE